ncbi:MAG TPA: hypothetical protein VGV64_02400 [Thermoplasmata archaeon]|nr:hypothetical protein [Thermoplasmata archaeon]
MEPWRRRAIDLSVEREYTDASGAVLRIRLASSIDVTANEAPPSPESYAEELRRLDRELGEAAALRGLSPVVAHRERDLEELVETFRPRQPELIEALRAEGAITETESGLLTDYLASRPPPAGRDRPAVRPTSADSGPSAPERPLPLAAMPLANDRTPASPRPVDELLTTYRIETLKQAGAVRARRQISYDEYMALKRHFSDRAAA